MSDGRTDLVVRLARMREVIPQIITTNNPTEFSELVRRIDGDVRETHEIIQALKRHRQI
jgi:hypothetical protein